MTTQEAIDFFKDFLVGLDFNDPIRSNDYSKSSELAIKALEKQAPKKPESETYFKHYSYQKRCPVCNDWLILEGGIKMNYCCNCGQAIDWEVSE